MLEYFAILLWQGFCINYQMPLDSLQRANLDLTTGLSFGMKLTTLEGFCTNCQELWDYNDAFLGSNGRFRDFVV